ncbi:MAG TPA: serine/threonine-protein kinase, partial [Polyangia bacterium]|nr:serine/threonine-protein kinase [Polyangia bacterium]
MDATAEVILPRLFADAGGLWLAVTGTEGWARSRGGYAQFLGAPVANVRVLARVGARTVDFAGPVPNPDSSEVDGYLQLDRAIGDRWRLRARSSLTVPLSVQAQAPLPPRANRQLPVSVIAGILNDVLTGLHAIHEATNRDGTPLNIIHRDVSSRNVLVGADGRARLIDFGIACVVGQDTKGDNSGLRGTPPYMAPEHIQHRPLDRRADLFSAGVVLWQLLTGQRLFRGTSPGAVWSEILHGRNVKPSRLNPDVPRALDTVVLQALARDRDRRFPTALAFAEALRHAAPIASPSVIASWTAGLARRPAVSAQATRKKVKGAARRGHTWYAIAGASLLALLTGGAARLASSRRIPAHGLNEKRVTRMAPDSHAASRPPDPKQPPEIQSLPPPVRPMPPPPPLTPVEPAPAPPEIPSRTTRTAAGGRAAVAELANLNRRAESALRAGDFAEARRLLAAALAMAAAAKLSRDPQTALAHARLAVVLVEGYSEESAAVKQFRMALLV